MAVTNVFLENLVKKQLETVCDPEITTVSIVDLGMVERVVVDERKATVELLPTFLGCPALGIIKAQVERALREIRELEEVEVKYIKSPPWTSDRITEKGREGLKEFGIAPPPVKLEEDGTWEVACPYCGSKQSTMENIFGPSACRSIHYCKNCRNPFEAMKPIATM